MTIEKLLNCSADELDTFSGAQLNEWFSPLLPTTRPDMVIKDNANKRMSASSSKRQQAFSQQMELDKRMAVAREIAAKMGVKL